MSALALHPTALLYALVFGLAALGCFVSLPRLRNVEDADTRRGLVALVLTSGSWALTHVGLLLSPTRGLKLGWYMVGLVLGVVTVGAWLYFCSAYSGRTYHRNPTYRRAAIAVFAVIIGVKLTNPLHGQYFSARMVETPFPHLAVSTGPLHWTAMGLSYALALVGAFMLLDLFTGIDLDTRPLVGLVGLTGLPVVADLVGFGTPLLADITYEPIGVAAFAVGLGFVYLDRFDTVRLAAERDAAVVSIDRDGNVRDTNQSARRLFPDLEAAKGSPLETTLPKVADILESDDPILEVRREGSSQFLRLTESPYGPAKSGLGRMIVFTDVTERERYRRELERQNDRLERFAGVISHDLRNPLGIAQVQLNLIRDELGSDHEPTAQLGEALERMDSLVEEMLTLARQGKPVEQWDAVRLSLLAEDCWEMGPTDGATLRIDEDLTFLANASRLRRLFENLFRNCVEHGSPGSRPQADDAIEHGDPDVAVTGGALSDRFGFYVEDDGPGIDESERETVFGAGYTTSEEGTGFGLAIVQETVAAHGWEISVTESADGGARFEITGVRLVE